MVKDVAFNKANSEEDFMVSGEKTIPLFDNFS